MYKFRCLINIAKIISILSSMYNVIIFILKFIFWKKFYPIPSICNIICFRLKTSFAISSWSVKTFSGSSTAMKVPKVHTYMYVDFQAVWKIVRLKRRRKISNKKSIEKNFIFLTVSLSFSCNTNFSFTIPFPTVLDITSDNWWWQLIHVLMILNETNVYRSFHSNGMNENVLYEINHVVWDHISFRIPILNILK